MAPRKKAITENTPAEVAIDFERYGVPASLAYGMNAYAKNTSPEQAVELAQRLLGLTPTGKVNTDLSWAYSEHSDKNAFLEDYNNARKDSEKADIESDKRESKKRL